MPNNITIERIELTRYVQSTFKIKTDEKVIWIDPFGINSEHIGNDKADLILVTHEHGDHFNLDSINEVSKNNTELVCNNSGIIEKISGNVTAEISVAKEDSQLTVSTIPITGVAGYNDIHPRNDGFNSFNIGFILTINGNNLLHTGDTDIIDEFANFGSVDIALLPIGGTYTMDESDAARAVTQMLKPKLTIPMHYGYATGGDPKKFKELVGGASKVEILDAILPPRNMSL